MKVMYVIMQCRVFQVISCARWIREEKSMGAYRQHATWTCTLAPIGVDDDDDDETIYPCV